MARPPERPTGEVWTVFGRWRRRSPASRRLGIALLALALVLTLIWARTSRAAGEEGAGRDLATVAAAPAPAGVPAPPCAPSPRRVPGQVA